MSSSRFNFKALLGAVLFLALAACSTQNREASPQASSQELYSLISNIQAGAMGSDPVLSSLNVETLAQGKLAIIYHAREESGRPAASVLSVDNVNVIGGSSGLPTYAVGLADVDVVFLDRMGEEGRTFTLMIRMGFNDGGGDVYFASSSQPEDFQFTDNSFQTQIMGADGQVLILKSTDLSAQYQDELADSVKLEIYTVNGQLIGQVSTMAGFGNR